MLRGHVFSEQVFGVDIFALFINQFLGGNNGIIQSYKNAMEMTNTSNSITIKNGAVVIQGRYLEEHTETIINYAKTDSLYCSLVIEIDLGKTNTRTSLEQAQYKILEGENDYPTLIQNDIINQIGNIYQFELARFQNGATGIINFTDRRNYLSFDSVYSGIIQDNLESDSSTSALSAKQGKVLNDMIGIEANRITLKDNIKIEYGTLTDVTVPASSYTAYTVNFSKAFTNPPVVIITPKGNYNIIGQVSSATKKQFVLNVRSVDGYERTERNYDWIAIGV